MIGSHSLFEALTEENIALGRIASASSQTSGAQFANDGSIIGTACFESQYSYSPWWSVNIGRRIYVKTVDVTLSPTSRE